MELINNGGTGPILKKKRKVPKKKKLWKTSYSTGTRSGMTTCAITTNNNVPSPHRRARAPSSRPATNSGKNSGSSDSTPPNNKSASNSPMTIPSMADLTSRKLSKSPSSSSAPAKTTSYAAHHEKFIRISRSPKSAGNKYRKNPMTRRAIPTDKRPDKDWSLIQEPYLYNYDNYKKQTKNKKYQSAPNPSKSPASFTKTKMKDIQHYRGYKSFCQIGERVKSSTPNPVQCQKETNQSNPLRNPNKSSTSVNEPGVDNYNNVWNKKSGISAVLSNTTTGDNLSNIRPKKKKRPIKCRNVVLLAGLNNQAKVEEEDLIKSFRDVKISYSPEDAGDESIDVIVENVQLKIDK